MTKSSAPAGNSSALRPTAGATGVPLRYDSTRNAAADVAGAIHAATADHKPVLLDFGANWCPDCVMIGRLYETPRVAALLRAHYHLVLVDVGRYDANLPLAARYVTLTTSGIPALVVLHPDGRIAYASNSGAFRNARTMTAAQLITFLTTWSTTR